MDTSNDRRFVNSTRGTVLAERALIAASFFLRLRGLLLRPALAAGQGLYLERCNCIHMFGMSYPIDAVFIDGEGRVVGLVESIKPGAVSPLFRGACGCLELPAGTIRGSCTELGDLVESLVI